MSLQLVLHFIVKPGKARQYGVVGREFEAGADGGVVPAPKIVLGTDAFDVAALAGMTIVGKAIVFADGASQARGELFRYQRTADRGIEILPVVAAVPPGDPGLFRMAVELAAAYSPITEDARSALAEEMRGVEPIFRYG